MVRQLREAAGLTQERCALEHGVGLRTLRDIEAGKCRMTALELVIQLRSAAADQAPGASSAGAHHGDGPGPRAAGESNGPDPSGEARPQGLLGRAANLTRAAARSSREETSHAPAIALVVDGAPSGLTKTQKPGGAAASGARNEKAAGLLEQPITPHADDESGKTAGLGSHRIEALENDATVTRPKLRDDLGGLTPVEGMRVQVEVVTAGETALRGKAAA